MRLAHGSNDGQKGVGLIILIGTLPGGYSLDADLSSREVAAVRFPLPAAMLLGAGFFFLFTVWL